MNDRIELLKGDITKIKIQIIVNAANSGLHGGGGVDGAIHMAGGPLIHDQCMRIKDKMGGCPMGEAVITEAGKLQAKFVIHTVGPIWSGGEDNEPEILANAYRNTLELAIDFNLSELAFPNISTGAYGFPKEQAAEIAINTVSDFMDAHEKIKRVIFVCFDNANYEIYKNLLS